MKPLRASPTLGTAFLALLALLMAGMPAWAAQLVVVESTVKGLAAGQVLDETVTLQVPAGATVTVISEDGKVSKLAGPYNGKPAASAGSSANAGTVQALSRLFVSNQPSATSLGTFRGEESAATVRGGDPAMPGEVWAVDVRRSETACVPAGEKLNLWLPESAVGLEIILLHVATGREATLAFSATTQTQPWPDAVPMLDGGEYAIRDTGNRWERRLSLRIVPADRSSEIERAAWMSDAGCFRQARALLAQAL